MRNTIIGIICPKHGYKRMGSCDECENGKKGEVTSIHIFKPMVYNDICETPILIESKKQLKSECKKHGVVAARLL